MRILLTERFQRSIRKLSKVDHARCFELLLLLPGAMGNPHHHSGFGLRKIHKSGIWEARVGLDLRLIFAYSKRELVLVTVGSHDDVRKFLSSL